MNAQEFQALAAFLKTASGLSLTPEKEYLLTSRLKPVAAQHGLKSVEELAGKLRLGASEALKHDVVEAMTTNETSFFRDGLPFEILKAHVVPELLQKKASTRAIRILCAAASSGQEPYSIAMVMADVLTANPGWTAEILGVDIDRKILSKAEQGLYTQLEVQRGLPIQLLAKFMEQKANLTWQVKPAVRNLVRFRHCNLVQPFRDLGQFDVVFCRNVLIYFDDAQKRDVLNRLSDHVNRDGYLFLGGAETIIGITDRFTALPGRRGVYTPVPKPGMRVAI